MDNQIWTKVAALLAALMVLAAPLAASAAEQMNAADDPQVSGPLELRSDDCRSQEEKDTTTGEVIARGKTCLRVYSYSPASETDTERNYGVVWLQSNVNSRAGWCAASVESDIDLPKIVAVESKAPKSMDVNRRKIFDTLLTTNAAGNGTEEASIKQTQILYPRSVRTSVVADTNVFRLKWRGVQDARLGFASGAEISWPVDQEPRITFRLNYELKRGTC